MGDGKLGNLLMFVSHCLLWRQQVPQGTTALIFRTGLRTVMSGVCMVWIWAVQEGPSFAENHLARGGSQSCRKARFLPRWHINFRLSMQTKMKPKCFHCMSCSTIMEALVGIIFLAPTNSSKYYFTNLPLAYFMIFIDKDFVLLRHWFSIIFSQIRLK